MCQTKTENLLEIIEKLREELKMLGRKNNLTNGQVIKKSKQLDYFLNLYYDQILF